MNPMTKRLGVLLAVSVAINIFLAGFLLARGLSHHPNRHPPHGPPGMHQHGPRWTGALIGPDAGVDPAQLDEIFGHHSEQLRAQRKALRGSRRAVREALAAEPFDPKALEAAFAQLRQHTGQSQAAMHAALVELAQRLPKEQRMHLSKRSRRLMRNR